MSTEPVVINTVKSSGTLRKLFSLNTILTDKQLIEVSTRMLEQYSSDTSPEEVLSTILINKTISAYNDLVRKNQRGEKAEVQWTIPHKAEKDYNYMGTFLLVTKMIGGGCYKIVDVNKNEITISFSMDAVRQSNNWVISYDVLDKIRNEDKRPDKPKKISDSVVRAVKYTFGALALLGAAIFIGKAATKNKDVEVGDLTS